MSPRGYRRLAHRGRAVGHVSRDLEILHIQISGGPASSQGSAHCPEFSGLAVKMAWGTERGTEQGSLGQSPPAVPCRCCLLLAGTPVNLSCDLHSLPALGPSAALCLPHLAPLQSLPYLSSPTPHASSTVWIPVGSGAPGGAGYHTVRPP